LTKESYTRAPLHFAKSCDVTGIKHSEAMQKMDYELHVT
jgi:hypothetical protein